MGRTESEVWQFIRRGVARSGSGNTRGECLFCGHTATCAPQQWWHHLQGCKGPSSEARKSDRDQYARAKRLAEAAIGQEKAKRQRKDASARATAAAAAKETAAAAAAAEAAGGSASDAVHSAIGRSLVGGRSSNADAAIARFIFANNLPLRLLDDHFFRQMVAAVQEAPQSYVPPRRQRLTKAGGLLQGEVERLQGVQEELLARDRANFGLCISSDGFTDAFRRPLLNVVLISPSGEFFVDAIDTSGNTKSMDYIANQVRRLANFNNCCAACRMQLYKWCILCHSSA